MALELKDRRRAHYPYIEPHSTRWLDNDAYGHVNNSIYYHFFDAIVNAYLIKQCGLRPTSSPIIGLVVHSHCDFFAPVEYPQRLDIGMRVKRLGKSSVTYECAIFVTDEPSVKAVGEFVHVYVDRTTRKPRAEGMASDMRESLSLLESRQAKL